MVYQHLAASNADASRNSISESTSGQRHDRIQDNINQQRSHLPPKDDEDEVGGGDGVSIAQKMLSAVSGSILTSLLVTPLDVVRVRLQSQHHHSPSPSSSSRPTLPSSGHPFNNLPPNLGISACCRDVFWVGNNAPYCVAGPNVSVVNNAATTTTASANLECAVEETQRKTFTSTLDGLRKIARNEGPQTLWRGLTPTLVMAVPANVIYFAGYDWLRTAKRSPLYTMSVSDAYAPLVAGSAARVLAALVVSPIEMFRTRMQAAQSSSATGLFRETMTGMRDMVSHEGYASLWRGINLTLWRDVPFSALYWWGYEAGRNRLTDIRERARGRERTQTTGIEAVRARSRSRSRENHAATLVDSFVAGAASGAVAAFVTTPFDVGKTRQQIVQHSNSSSKESSASKTAAGSGSKSLAGRMMGKSVLPEDMPMPRFLWHIFKEQGMSGLFRGWAARCLKVAPACAIMISSYEIGKKMAGGVNERKESET
ncbi:hypothetical protein LTS18_006457 [Coniosporium uncinatum]|uniref:Uncharacterized protein n=1 Tax=Coniosporium uncinatum TaxID=93489 RepID=A0ACC3DB23_9PEZI|nr:hypothetical protein LTS18_006457 [Coniosporium uncinatum]